MRWDDIILEGPEEDFDTHKLATDLRDGIICRFLDARWKNINWGGRGQIMSDGRKFVRFPPGVFGWTAPFEKAVFALGPTDSYFPTGFYTRTTSGAPFVALNMVEDPTDGRQFEEAVKALIHNQRAHEVLLHELIHMIDDFRGHDVLRQKSDPDGSRAAASDNTEKKDGPDYYNSPVEFNAYFNNIADRLLSFIARNRDHADAHRTLGDAQHNGLSTDFVQTVANLLKEKAYVPALSKFVKMMRKRNHRRMLSRLYKIHQEAAEIIRWAEQAG